MILQRKKCLFRTIAGEKAMDKAQEKDYKAAKKENPEGVRRYSLGNQVDEAAKLKGKQTKLDVDHDGDIEADDLADLRAGKKKKVDEAEGSHSSKRFETDSQRIARMAKEKKQAEKEKSEKKVDESKPSAGLSKAEKSATVKKAKAGGDIGKPGKGFDKLAKKAGGGEKGEKIAAAAMWKNIKETQAYIAEKAKAAKPDFLDMDKDGDKKEPMKKAVADKKETVKESTDFSRMQEQLARLNRTEKPALVENREVDQIRALTKRLLG